MNIHAAAAYATHFLTARSTAGHGVHSPLMFRFITEVIGGKTDKEILEEVSSLRKEMLSDRRVIRVTDLGAGSSVTGSDERRISSIASVAALPAREAGLLSRMAASLDSILVRVPGLQANGLRESGGQTNSLQVSDPPGKGNCRQANGLHVPGLQANGPQLNSPGDPGCQADGPQPNTPPDQSPVILELGTSLGISTLALALGAPHKRVITVEGCPELAAIAGENLRRHGARNAEVLNMEFSQALSLLKSSGTQVELAFIDGNHRGAALTQYANIILSMGDDMVIVVDDIRLNRDMIQAWKSLCKRSHSDPLPVNHAMASLETFRLGILFCIQNLTPGCHRIRY